MSRAKPLENLVTGVDVARRLGLSRERVRQLAERNDFPDPIGKFGPAIVWRWTEIEKWAHATGRTIPPVSDA